MLSRSCHRLLSLARVLICSLLGAFLATAQSASPTSAGRSYQFTHLDVFTRIPLTGNQLAVFLQPEGLTEAEMMALTREMAFPESTFVFPAEMPTTDFRVRIFGLNTGGEIPVAGHPTIGTTFALANAGKIKPGRQSVVLGLGIGPTKVDLEWTGNRLEFAWMQQRLPEFGGEISDVSSVAAALGITPADIAAKLPIQQVSCGAPFLLVPVSSRAAVDRASLNREAMGRLIDAAGLTRRGVYVFSLEPGEDKATLYSRMFGFGVVEDPATGNASGPAGAYLAHYRLVTPAQAHHMISRQGVKMGRASEVHIGVELSGGQIKNVRIGGSAVQVATTSIRVSN